MSIYKEKVLSNLGLPEGSYGGADFWLRNMIEHDRDETIKASAAIFDMRHSGLSFINQMSSVSIVEAARVGSEQSADIVLLRKLKSDKLLFFVGDGVKYFDTPPNEVSQLLKTYECSERPDAFIGKLLRNNFFANRVFDSVEKDNPNLNIGVSFFNNLEKQLNRFYKGNEIDTVKINKSQLPSITGVIAVVGPKNVEISRIGDPITSYDDETGVTQPLLPRENLGIDRLTRDFVNLMLENEQASTVTEALNSEIFKKWIIHTFNQKMNKVVATVNGKDFDPSRVVSMTLPIFGIKNLRLGSDGISLGKAELEEESILELTRSSRSAKDLLKYAGFRLRHQIEGFDDKRCKQDRKSDDLAGVNIGFENDFSLSELLAGFKT